MLIKKIFSFFVNRILIIISPRRRFFNILNKLNVWEFFINWLLLIRFHKIYIAWCYLTMIRFMIMRLFNIDNSLSFSYFNSNDIYSLFLPFLTYLICEFFWKNSKWYCFVFFCLWGKTRVKFSSSFSFWW